MAISSEGELSPKVTKILPKPYSLRKDISPVEERASFNFSVNQTTTSFKGEYPFSMSNLGGGSLITIFKGNSRDPKNHRNFIILMNLNRKITKNNKHKVYMLDPYNKKILAEVLVKNNSFNIICLNNHVSEKLSKN